jgi:hypothetical protein
MAVNIRNLALLVVAIIIVAFAVYEIAFSSGGSIAVNGPTTITFTKTPTNINVGGTHYEVSFASSSAGVAYLDIYTVPVLEGSVYNVTLISNSTTHANIGTASANIGIMPNRITDTSVNVTIFPIAQYAGTSPDAGKIRIIPQSELLGIKVTAATTIAATTTLSVSGTTAATTAATTTIVTVNATLQKINSMLNTNPDYNLMLNYSKLYSSESGCTATAYGNDYFEKYSSVPRGPVDYANATQNAPHALTHQGVMTGTNTYTITFRSIVNIPAFDNKTAATITLNQTYSSLQADYQSSLGYGSCAGLVP